MKIQRLLPKSMRRNAVVRAMPRWTTEPESTEWFDNFNLDGEELIGFVPEPQQPKKRNKEEKKRQEKKALKGEKKKEPPKPTQMGFVVVDGKQHVIALGTPASYQVVVEEEFKALTPQDNDQVHKRQQKAKADRAQHLQMVVELMQKSFLASSGRLLIAELVVAGPASTKDDLIKLLPQQLAKIASSKTTCYSGKSGLWELVQGMLAEEFNQQRERLGLKPKKYKPGMPMPVAQCQQLGRCQQVGKHQQADKQQKADKQKSGKHQQADKQQKADKQKSGKHQQGEPKDCAKQASKQPAK
ncbi:uncharacterized protein LOC119590345 [Penaeus monodon]|uniref:uncharacterized protein LOC119590345 n=1 Tax=Penaeus monodon TaxID=6687 RepID=UPI0018A7CE11|nr:uncharacterized protein LOC119590345 [Penaeus monodon]